jgi:anaerobic selenocysteine-containing dehydrogenase
MARETRHRICSICEATCGLEIDVEDGAVVAIRGHEADVLSRGYICPKGFAMKELHADPDRLQRPLVRRGGDFVEVSWDEAFAEIERRLMPIMAEHGRQSVALYFGNPGAHSFSIGLYLPVLARAVGTQNVYSAATLDQIPRHLASGLMYGDWMSVPVPDIDRTDLLVVIGGNPMVSNGSMWTVPDFRGRAKAMKARGGRLVVIDPKRTLTAKLADEHHFIVPGTDALLLAAMIQSLIAEGLVDLGRLEGVVAGLDRLEDAVRDVTPEIAAPVTGIPAAEIRRLAREIALTERAAVYGRMGTSTQEFGSLASWLIDVLNIVTGHLDEEGGAMFPLAPAFQNNSRGPGGRGRGVMVGRRRTRVRNAPELMGEFPAVCLAEEIETPGEGRIRALFTIAGNPVLSSPDGARLGRAFGSLDFMVSLDIYLNETTRHADVILPGMSPFEEGHYDTAFPQLSVRNYARYSPPLFPRADRPAEWEILLELASIAGGRVKSARQIDDDAVAGVVRAAVAQKGGPVEGRDPDEILDMLSAHRGPERQLDLQLRTGPHGDAFGARPDGLSLAKLIETPAGIDLGALHPRMPQALRTPDGRIDLAPEAFVADMPRLRQRAARGTARHLLLVGRRDVRTNNSWLHNLPVLAKGPNRCTLQIHPEDARARGLETGDLARVAGPGGAIEIEVEVTEDIMRGVVSAPHGFGHDQQGTRLSIARERPGANSNQIADMYAVDPLSGNAVLNGIPVEVRRADAQAA